MLSNKNLPVIYVHTFLIISYFAFFFTRSSTLAYSYAHAASPCRSSWWALPLIHMPARLAATFATGLYRCSERRSAASFPGPEVYTCLLLLLLLLLEAWCGILPRSRGVHAPTATSRASPRDVMAPVIPPHPWRRLDLDHQRCPQPMCPALFPLLSRGCGGFFAGIMFFHYCNS